MREGYQRISVGGGPLGRQFDLAARGREFPRIELDQGLLERKDGPPLGEELKAFIDPDLREHFVDDLGIRLKKSRLGQFHRVRELAKNFLVRQAFARRRRSFDLRGHRVMKIWEYQVVKLKKACGRIDVTRNVDLAAVDVQNRVNQSLGRLPNEVKNTGVIITKQIGGFVFGAGVYSDTGQYDSLFLSNYMDVYVKDALKRVKGVGDAVIFGERKYAMRLWLDPAKLAQRGLTATNVVSALQEQNVQVPAGQIGQPPSQEGQAYQISVRAVGRLSEAAEFDRIILKTGADGTMVRLKDVGHAELGAENYGTVLRFNGHDAVGLAVTLGSNVSA